MRIALAAAAVLLTACAGVDSRPVTGDEANRLALVRLANHNERGAAFSTTLVDQGRELAIRGWVDWRRPMVYAAVNGAMLVQAVPGALAELQQPAEVPPLPVPQGQWRARPLRPGPQGSPFDSFLAIMLGLAADRPDNPQLLLQQGAAWIGEDGELDGFRGPNSGRDGSRGGGIRYWIDRRGRLHRLELTLGTAEPMTVLLERGSPPAITPVGPLA
ncbi:hypothetical protein ACIBG8_47900 [Nonomuraea sp. NPDC050556]|uniref:hypothetical protein n=1 Tax=Nonomuraea sp. NPDC050556 TaxID=3364369 RepID=UPI0037975013